MLMLWEFVISCDNLINVVISTQRDNSTEYRKRANFPESIEFSGISLYYTNEVYECPCNFAISR